MHRKWIGMALAVMMLLGLSVPAFGSDEPKTGEARIFEYGDLKVEVSNVKEVRQGSSTLDTTETWKYDIYVVFPGAAVTIINADTEIDGESGSPHAEWAFYLSNDSRIDILDSTEPLKITQDILGIYNQESSVYVLGFELYNAENTSPQKGGIFTDVEAGAWYEDAVMQAYERGIVKGVTDSTFAPNGTTTRGQTVTMLYRAMGSPGGANVFSDTSGEVGSAAGWASASGVTNGVSATAFAPEASITREQLVTMLYRLAGSPAADTAVLGSYTDGGSVQGYARSAVAWALGKGLLTGYGDGTIRPAATATRAEVCALIVRYLGA